MAVSAAPVVVVAATQNALAKAAIEIGQDAEPVDPGKSMTPEYRAQWAMANLLEVLTESRRAHMPET